MPPYAHPHLKHLPLLPIGATGAVGVDRIVPLANNEISDPPTQRVRDAVSQAMDRANFYPEVDYGPLRAGIAARYGVDPACIALGNGSSELIATLAQAYCGHGDEVIIGKHGYLNFAICTQLAGGTSVYSEPDATGNLLRFDPDAALAKVTDRTRMVYLDNPSNPLGTYVGKAALTAFREALREDILLVLDGAYADYADAEDFDPGDDLVRSTQNTVVLRTFSKIYGLAGLRIGWAHAPANIMEILARVMRPGNLSHISTSAAEAVLAEPEAIARRKQLNARIRDQFASRLQDKLGFRVLPSQTNFVLATPPSHAPLDAMALLAALEEKGVLVRSMVPYGLGDSVRISIGTEEEMQIAFEAIEALETP